MTSVSDFLRLRFIVAAAAADGDWLKVSFRRCWMVGDCCSSGDSMSSTN